MKNSNLLHNKEGNAGSDWRRFLLLMIVILPLLAFCLIGAYGLGVWIMQLLFWGPPS